MSRSVKQEKKEELEYLILLQQITEKNEIWTIRGDLKIWQIKSSLQNLVKRGKCGLQTLKEKSFLCWLAFIKMKFLGKNSCYILASLVSSSRLQNTTFNISHDYSNPHTSSLPSLALLVREMTSDSNSFPVWVSELIKGCSVNFLSWAKRASLSPSKSDFKAVSL